MTTYTGTEIIERARRQMPGRAAEADEYAATLCEMLQIADPAAIAIITRVSEAQRHRGGSLAARRLRSTSIIRQED